MENLVPKSGIEKEPIVWPGLYNPKDHYDDLMDALSYHVPIFFTGDECLVRTKDMFKMRMNFDWRHQKNDPPIQL